MPSKEYIGYRDDAYYGSQYYHPQDERYNNEYRREMEYYKRQMHEMMELRIKETMLTTTTTFTNASSIAKMLNPIAVDDGFTF